MAARTRHHHQRPRRQERTAPGRIGRNALLAPPLGIVVIVGLAYAAAQAQASAEVFVAAGLIFSLCEGVVLALVGLTWSGRGVVAALLAAALTAALAAPVRWQVALVTGYGQTAQPLDFGVDLVVSLAWGALAGAAGATVLRPKLAALMHTDEDRFADHRRL